ncbi:MAG: hypothetical protein ACXAC7_10970 [Candidatus Hodarchaeales archaeon]|jgi:hypothetical protein
MFETYFIFYSIGFFVSFISLIRCIQSRSSLNELVTRIPDDAEKALEQLMEEKRRDPFKASREGLQKTIFFKWWMTRMLGEPLDKKEGFFQSFLSKLYSISEHGPIISVIFFIALFSSFILSTLTHSFTINALTIIIFLVFILYFDQTKVLIAIPFIPFMLKHEKEMKPVDWGLVSQLEEFFYFRIFQFAFFSCLFIILLVFHHLLFDLLIILVFLPIGSAFLFIIYFISDNYGQVGIIFIMIILMLGTPGYMIFVEKVVFRGFIWLITRYMIYGPFMKLLPPKDIDLY